MGSRRRFLRWRRSVSALLVFCAVAGGLEPVAADPPPDREPPVVPDWWAQLAKGDPADDVTSPPTQPARSAPEIESTPLDGGSPAVRLPSAGTAEVTLADRGVARQAGESPVQVSAGSRAAVGGSVRVEVLDQKASERAGVHGFAFRLAGQGRASVRAGEKAPVSLSVDYSGFANLYGGGYADRLRVVVLPECAVADPVPAGCDVAGTPLPTRNDRASQRLEVTVEDLAGLEGPAAVVAESSTTSTTSSATTTTTSSTTTSTTTTSTTVPADDEAPRETTIVTEPTSSARPAVPAQAGGGATVLAVTAGPEGPEGSYKATPFELSGDWQVGVGSGEFSWTYNVPVLAAPAGATPDVSLSYSSGAVDGMVTGKNTQPGNVGMGWGDFANAFIERRYNSCSNEGTQLGDLCWAKQNASISLNGQSAELVEKPGTNGRDWVVKDDPRWVVQRLTVADYPQIDNGDNDGEHWKVTTPDGTQYWFGISKDPEQLETPFVTASTWTVPVVGDDTGEPCHGATSAASLCTQAWRWNLDRVLDPNGNERWYQYAAETNHYQAVSGAAPYIRSGYLKRIWYGTYLDEDAYSASVIFDINFRCNTLDAPGTPTCVHPSEAPAGMTYPDVPLDLQCDGGTCTNTSPTFFSKERYTGVHVCVRGRLVASVCEDVDYFKFTHEFSGPNNPNHPTEMVDSEKLFLKAIQRTGRDLGATDSPVDDPTLVLPPTTFAPKKLANRHLPGAGESTMEHWRIGRVTDEFGREVNVTYGQPHPCPAVLPTFWDNNTKDCLPQFWAPEGQSPTLRAFNKWLVTQVEVKALNGNSPSGSSPPMVTKYFYGNQINTAPAAPQSWNAARDQAEAAWHHAHDPFTPQAFQSWSQWRGYQDVLVVQGQSRTRYKVYRGMNGDLIDGGTRTATISSLDGTVTNTPDDNWFAGRILDQASLRSDGSEETGTVHGYQRILVVNAEPSLDPVDDANWVGENDTVTRLRTPAAGTVYRRQRTQVAYNGFLKFPEQVIEHGWTDASGDERCTKTEYVISFTPIQMLDYPQRVTRYDNGTACSGTAVTRAETAYDGGAVGASPTKGNPTTSRVQVSAAPSPNGTWSVSTTTYDRFGRPITVTDPNGHTTTTQRGNNNNDLGYPEYVEVTNALGHQTHTQVAYGRQLPAWSEDANDKRTTFAYDALGRASSVWQPTELTSGPASWVFSYDIDPERDEVPVIQTRQLQDTLGAGGAPRYLDTWVLYDSLLRERQTHTRSPDTAKVVVSDKTYDDQGRLKIANVPEAVTGTPGNALLALATPANLWRNWTETTYDPMSRPTRERFYADDGDADAVADDMQRDTTTTYTHETAVVDPLVGGNTSTKTDGLGRTIEVAEHDGTAYRTTTYGYNKADQLLSVKDPANNTINYTYDMAGRRTTMDDPDAGDWSYGYDPAGNQTSVTDATLAQVHTNYDNLNRPIRRRKDNPTTGQILATWTYDNPGGPGTADDELGLLDKSTRVVSPTVSWDVDVTGYDARNRPTGRTWTVPTGLAGLTGSYTVTYGYDKADHPTSVGYPAVGGLPLETVTTTYDAFGLPDTMTGASPYVSFSWYDDRGRPALFGFGSSSNYSMSKLWQYDLNQQLKLQQATATGGGLVQDRSISYDQAGNITERNTTLSGASFKECFGYDQRQRLTAAYTTTPATTCPSGTNKGTGANPYNHTYTYSHDGNLLTRVEGASPPITYSYPTGGPGSTRPHAPTAVGSNGYTWNANGNQATRTIGGQTQTLTWDAEHRLASLNGPAGNNAFTYDADGTRLLRQTPAGTTLYIEGHEITVPAGQSTATAVRSYGFAGQPTATRTPAGLDYLVTDNQGSVEQTIPAGSTTAEFTRTYFPYGKLRTGGQPDTDHSWIGQVEDDTTALQYLNARYYDPTTGVFTAPDPLADLRQPKTFNPYGYGVGNPPGRADPSGLIPQECTTKEINCVIDRPGLLRVTPDPICWCPSTLPAGGDYSWAEGVDLEELHRTAGSMAFGNSLGNQQRRNRLGEASRLLMLLERELERRAWEEMCGGPSGFTGHGECRSRWWKDWGPAAKLTAGVIVGAICIASTGPESGGTSTSLCVGGVKAIAAVEVVDSASQNGVFPSGQSPDWAAFGRDVGKEVFLYKLGQYFETTESTDLFLEEMAKIVSETPGMLEDLSEVVSNM